MDLPFSEQLRARAKKAILEFITSKKAAALVAGVIVIAGQKLGIPISDETANQIALLLASYIVGQGIADAGKKPTP